MPKGWFRLSRPSRTRVSPQDPGSQREAAPEEKEVAGASEITEEEITPAAEVVPEEVAAPDAEEAAAAATTAEAEEAAKIAEATPADEATPTQDVMPAQDGAPVEESASAEEPAPADEATSAEDVAPAEEAAPALPPRAALALGGDMPSYVDTRSAGDWLAMLSQISAVSAYKALSYDLLDPQPGERVVDVGCGLGHDARELARRVGPSGAVVGVDGSAEMIERATAATDEATARMLSFITADAMNLPLDTQTFDGLRADRLLQHVDDPLRALLEFRRALRPGGRIVLIEPDWKTMAVYPGSAAGGDDDTCAAAIFDWQVAHTSHPLIGRQLRMLLTQAGFVNITVSPVAYASTHFIEADLTLELTRAANGAAEQWPARLSAADAQAWRVTAQAADAAGHFFASVPLFFAHATKG
ncbi:MAG: methyltransferase domain-containing protein [Chloroflexota bacterium]|nr:methyltransferase domain-containing protein [Chloroflexota bacterium]